MRPVAVRAVPHRTTGNDHRVKSRTWASSYFLIPAVPAMGLFLVSFVSRILTNNTFSSWPINRVVHALSEQTKPNVCALSYNLWNDSPFLCLREYHKECVHCTCCVLVAALPTDKKKERKTRFHCKIRCFTFSPAPKTTLPCPSACHRNHFKAPWYFQQMVAHWPLQSRTTENVRSWNIHVLTGSWSVLVWRD